MASEKARTLTFDLNEMGTSMPGWFAEALWICSSSRFCRPPVLYIFGAGRVAFKTLTQRSRWASRIEVVVTDDRETLCEPGAVS